MINDATLKDYLASSDVIKTRTASLPFIGNDGETLVNWQVQFNHLTPSEMYTQYKQLTNQLMYAQMDEQKRLTLMAEVLKVVERLIAPLHHLYQNQVGFLDEKQQQALDMVLSVYYQAIMFYHSVWQRVAQLPDTPEKKSLGAMLGLTRSSTTNVEIMRYCVHMMIALLRQALFEKHVGYRKDTQLIWRYLNACYQFATSYDWQIMAANKLAKSPLVATTIEELYRQCLFAESINPYSLRRPDILQLQTLVPAWSHWMGVTKEPAEQPFLFINLQSDEPPQLLHAGVAFNPFDHCETCLFLTFSSVQQQLNHLAQQPLEDLQVKSQARLAKLVLASLTANLKPAPTMTKSQESCQAVVGFSQIHYMLANKTSLGNLIQAHALPERLRPRNYNQSSLNKSTTVDIISANQSCYTLHYQYDYQGFEFSDNFQGTRSVEPNAINQLQVKSLVALRKPQDTTKTWYLGQVMSIAQTPKAPNPPIAPKDSDEVAKSHTLQNSLTKAHAISLDICAQVAIIGSHLVPCGVRIQNDDHRPLNFVAAFIVPNNAEHTHKQTSLLMARFGYQVNDKLIIRIDSKEVNVRLTELLNITDDIEEYAFVRIQ